MEKDEEEMSTNTLIRVATESDVDTIVALNQALFQEDAGQRDPTMDLGWPQRSGHEYFATLLKQAEVHCLIAEDGDKPVGYLLGYLCKPSSVRPIKRVELHSMFVAADARSSGVGSELVNRFKAWCMSHDVERISVTAYAANARAIAFYRRHGFDARSQLLECSLVEDAQKSQTSFPERVAAELAAAKAAHAPMNSLHEGYAVLLEEVDELWDEIKAKVRNRENLEDETVQVAAMCQRLYEDVISMAKE